MLLSDILARAIEFGTIRSHDHFLSFALKIVFYIIPAVVVGNSTESLVLYLKQHNLLGETTLAYIVLQTFLIISTLYLLLLFWSDFIHEFQVTLAGAYFIVLYFGVQTNYITMIQDFMK